MDEWDWDKPRRPTLSYNMRDLLALVRLFVAGEVTAAEFADRYIETFKAATIENELAFPYLNQLFFDADDYYADPAKASAEQAAAADQLLTYTWEALAGVDKVIASTEQVGGDESDR